MKDDRHPNSVADTLRMHTEHARKTGQTLHAHNEALAILTTMVTQLADRVAKLERAANKQRRWFL